MLTAKQQVHRWGLWTTMHPRSVSDALNVKECVPSLQKAMISSIEYCRSTVWSGIQEHFKQLQKGQMPSQGLRIAHQGKGWRGDKQQCSIWEASSSRHFKEPALTGGIKNQP
eukprot:1160003-Pelagomonas_calceolata.AAC.2